MGIGKGMEQVTVIERPERRTTLVRPVGAVVAVVAGLGGVLLGVTMVLTPTAVPTGAAARPDALTLGRPLADPVSLAIPKLGLKDKTVIDLGHTPSGRREQPGTAQGVGWFADGPAPGQPGVAVLSGHATYGYNGGGFAGLDTLDPGSEIVVSDADHHVSRFVVRKTTRFPADSPDSVLTAPEAGGAELRLITCSGTYDSADISGFRVAVYAVPAP